MDIDSNSNLNLSLFPEGTAIWLPDEEHCWLKASVLECRPHATNAKKFILKCQLDDAHCEYETREVEFGPEQPCMRNTTLNEDRIDDLTILSYLNDPAVLNTINCRYQDNLIYTYSGLVLVSLNPYNDLGLYGDSLIQAYSGKSRGELEPHLFAVAEDAFRSMQRDQKNQSIIISGESGAGKTISARYVMRYFASATNSQLSDNLKSASSLVESRVLASNPILEAFGNAKTTRNDNSSRFGKYVQIFFNKKYEITGAAIKTYLLEKTRVIRQSPGERNYHIFYQLLEGSNPELRSNLKLDGLTWKDFEYLKVAGGSIENVDDSVEFAETVESLKIAGFSENVQLVIFKILSAILFLGNIKFTENAEDSSAILEKDDENLKTFAELIDVSGKDHELASWLTSKLLVTKLDSVEIKLTVKQAEAAKDAVAKYLYSKVFDFIVKNLNELLAPAEKEKLFIGVLDIYGFEKFDTNSFEQFCINYANEKLQHEFNQQVFKLEQELYEREKISWSFINFSDNQPCIDLIEIRGGILDLLDEECRFPNGGDQSFLDKIKAEIPKQGEDISKFLGKDPLELPGTFTIKHFAYNVAYNVDGFLEKNRDLVPGEIISILESENEIVGFEKNNGIVTDKRNTNSSSSSSTTGSSFRDSLNELMKIIQSTKVHYIRCIKPNNSKAAMSFESNFVMQQLRAGGIIETIKISAAGYPARWSFEEFYTRYSLLGVGENDLEKVKAKEYRELSESLLEAREDLTEDEFQIGKTKIFLRAGILARLEKKRTFTIKTAVTLIQTHLRTKWTFEKIKKQLEGVEMIQSAFKAHKALELYNSIRKDKAAELFSSAFKQYKVQDMINIKFRAIKMIQYQWKNHFERTIYAEGLRHRMVIKIQSCYRGKRLSLLSNLKSYSAKQIQSSFKRFSALKELKDLRNEAKSFKKLQEASLGLEKKVVELTRELESVKLEESLKAEEEEQKALEKIEQLELQIDEKDSNILNLKNQIKEYETKFSDLQNQIEEYEKKISDFEITIEGLNNKNNELAQRQSTQTLLHENELKTQKESHENTLKVLKSDNTGEWQTKYEEMRKEKEKIELKHAKVEVYVRALMANQIKTEKDKVTKDIMEQNRGIKDQEQARGNIKDQVQEVTQGNKEKKQAQVHNQAQVQAQEQTQAQVQAQVQAQTQEQAQAQAQAQAQEQAQVQAQTQEQAQAQAQEQAHDQGQAQEQEQEQEQAQEQELTQAQDQGQDSINLEKSKKSMSLTSPAVLFDKMGSQNSLMNFIADEDDSKLIKFTSTTEVLEDLLRSQSVLDELLFLLKSASIEDSETSDGLIDQEALMRPSSIIYSWLILSLSIPILNNLTENRMGQVLENIRVTLSESTDDKKCSLWMTNLINLYGMIHHFIVEKEEIIKRNHSKILLTTDQQLQLQQEQSIASSPTQISISEMPSPILLLIRAEIMRLIGDIYSAWLKELCRWFGRAGIAAILDHQALQNYKVRPLKKSEKFFESVLNSLNPSSSDSNSSDDENSLSIGELLDALDDLLAAFIKTTLDSEIIQSIMSVLFRHISTICFNQFLLRRNFVSWKRAIQIQFNLSRLENWSRERMGSFGLEGETVDLFAPLLQAVKVIQLAKTRGVDSSTLQQCAPVLTLAQIRRLLSNYVPDEFEDGPVPVSLIRQFPSPNQVNDKNYLNVLIPPLDLSKLTLPVALKERVPLHTQGMTSTLPLDMPPTLWKLFVLYLP